jgi:hypothetical protein
VITIGADKLYIFNLSYRQADNFVLVVRGKLSKFLDTLVQRKEQYLTLNQQIQRVVRRIDREISGPLLEFSEQFFYGHREILCVYGESDPRAILKGSMEHGWSALGPGRGIPKLPFGRYPHFAWNSIQISEYGPYPKNVRAIGAPFLYLHRLVLDKLENAKDFNISNANRTLFFPMHGTEDSTPQYDQQIEEFRKLYDPTNSTVCLFWTEFSNPRVVNAYVNAGFAVTCAGFSGVSDRNGLGVSSRYHAGSTIGGRHLFLLNILSLLNSFGNVVLGGLTTAGLYAAHLGKAPKLLPNSLSVKVEFSHLHALAPLSEMDRVYPNYKYIADRVSTSVDQLDFSSDEFKRFAGQQLGLQDMINQASMSTLFDGAKLLIASSIPTNQLKNAIENFESHSVSVFGRRI